MGELRRGNLGGMDRKCDQMLEYKDAQTFPKVPISSCCSFCLKLVFLKLAQGDSK